MFVKDLAEKYMGLVTREQVLPLDDVGFQHDSLESFARSIQKRRQTKDCKDYLFSLADLLAHTGISTHFGIHLLHEAYLGYGSRMTRTDPIVAWNKEYLGIDLSKNEYGIFDRTACLNIEDRYFERNLTLLVYKEQNFGSPVSLDNWMVDLHKRKSAL